MIHPVKDYIPLDTNGSFMRHSLEPISWRSTDETKPNTTKATMSELKSLSKNRK